MFSPDTFPNRTNPSGNISSRTYMNFLFFNEQICESNMPRKGGFVSAHTGFFSFENNNFNDALIIKVNILIDLPAREFLLIFVEGR